MTRRSLITLAAAALLAPARARAQPGGTPTECGGASEPPPPAAPLAPPELPPPSGVHWRDLSAASLVLLIGGLGLSYVVANERRRQQERARPPAGDRAPYVTGALLGLVFAVSLVALHHPVGVSGALQNLAGWLGHRLTPGVRYWGEVLPIGVTWQVVMLAGVFLGGLASAAHGGRLRVRMLPAQGWTEAMGPSVARRWAIAFGAAAVLEYAAAIAGGCTSGLALSGGIVLAPAAFLFMAAMFLGGIPTAFLIRWRRGRTRGRRAGHGGAP